MENLFYSLKMHKRPKASLTLKRSSGTKLFTEEYGELTDMESGCWASLIGHNDAEISESIKENIDKFLHSHQFFDTEHSGCLAKEISDAAELKGEYKGTFLTSGSEAVSLALAIANLITGRKKNLCFNITSLGAMTEVRMPRDSSSWEDLNVKDCIGCKKEEHCKECGKFDYLNFEDFSSFVFEPGNSGGLVLIVPHKLVKYLSEKIKDSGGLIIANEVTTGFGRTGKWFGFQHYDFLETEKYSPDIISMGKGIGNGYPVSGILVKSDIALKVENSDFKYVQSHIDDPLGCAVGRKVVEIIKKRNLIEKSAENGEYLREKLNEISEECQYIKDVRGRGMMNAVALSDEIKSEDVFIKLLEKGWFVGFSENFNLIRLYSPLILSKDEIDEFSKNFLGILEKF